METKEVHYVEYTSPGTFFHETSRVPIESWDTAKAVELAKDVTERYGAKPFAFQFVTMREAEPVDDGMGGKLDVTPKQTAKSDRYYLGGTIKSYDEVKAENDPKNQTLLFNMRANGFFYVIVNTNSWRSTQPFEQGEVVVDDAGEIVERGDAPDRVAYRKRMTEERDAR